MNDQAYGVIRNIQDAQYEGRRVYCRLTTPDFALFAKSIGLPHERVSAAEDFAAALDRGLAAQRPAHDRGGHERHRPLRRGLWRPARRRCGRRAVKLGLIGHGAVARQALGGHGRCVGRAARCRWRRSRGPEAKTRRAKRWRRLRASVAREIVIVTDIDAPRGRGPSLVAEAAGHEAVSAWGAAVLERGVDLLITSAGALSDPTSAREAGRRGAAGQAKWDICAGAVGGLDILAAACLSGVEEVSYTSRKPPLAWRGTAAERLIDLAGISRATVFYEGSAEAAARDYPQNANVAATIALKGVGFEKTRVRLVADPGGRAQRARNHHSLGLRGRRHHDRRPAIAGQSEDVDDNRVCVGRRHHRATEIALVAS